MTKQLKLSLVLRRNTRTATVVRIKNMRSVYQASCIETVVHSRPAGARYFMWCKIPGLATYIAQYGRRT